MILGFDLGGTQIKAGLVDRAGRVIATRKEPTPTDIAGTRATLEQLARSLTKESPEPVTGAGFASKGIIDPVTTRVIANPGPTVFLEGHTLASLVADALPPNCAIAGDNDARAALAGEVAWGAAKGRTDALLFTLGTGVGGGVLAGGRIIRGAGGIAGHLGHVTVDPWGAYCICGSRGCIETIFSARAIESAADEMIHRSVDTALRELPVRPPTCEQVFAVAQQGDAVARHIVDRAITALGAAIAGLVHALDPEVIIIGGQISEAGDFLFAKLRDELAWRTRKFLRREIPIVPAQVKDGIVGAAALVESA
ncbi:MAG TPA: ROK family protein [Bryobacteraceae bacterium]|jgi:glucokinase